MPPPADTEIPPMDHAAGHKETAFTWAMGMLILRRMGARETMAQITADPRMPAYCTVFQWVKVVPEFGEAYRQMRAALAQAHLVEREQKAAVLREARAAARLALGMRVRTWVSGRKSSYTREWAQAFCARVEIGKPVYRVCAEPGMPSAKAVYAWLRREPEFVAMFVKAKSDGQRWLGYEAEIVMDRLIDGPVDWAGFRAVKRQVARIEGQIGRLTPKVYRQQP